MFGPFTTTYEGPASFNFDAVFAAPPDEQKELLGKVLRPRINGLKPSNADKEVALIFEMDNSTLVELHMPQKPYWTSIVN